jgi:predicted transglutaminase-like protease
MKILKMYLKSKYFGVNKKVTIYTRQKILAIYLNYGKEVKVYKTVLIISGDKYFKIRHKLPFLNYCLNLESFCFSYIFSTFSWFDDLDIFGSSQVILKHAA